MPKKEFIRRCGLFIISLFVIGLGIALAKRAELGISPVSSVANVLSLRFDFLSLGMWLTITNFLMLLGQILLLRRKFQLWQLLQIPLSFLFGSFTDVGLWLVQGIPNNMYAVQLLLVLAGVAVLSVGITLGVVANVILNSPEAFVKALADTTGHEFGVTKTAFDVSWVLLAVVLSLIFFGGELRGIREGTVITAVLVGFGVKLCRRWLEKPLTRLLTK